MHKVMLISMVCLIGFGFLFGCTSSSPNPDRSKDYPLTITNSMFVPSILESSNIMKPLTGNSYLALKVKMENRGDKGASVGASEFNVLCNSQTYENKFSINTETDPRFDGQDFDSPTILPKSSVEGWMVFEVPNSIKTATKAELRFTDIALIEGGQYSKTEFNPSQVKQDDTKSARFTVEVKKMTITYKYIDKNNDIKTPSENKLFAVADIIITNNARTKIYLHIASDNIAFVTENDEYFRGTWNYAPSPSTPLESQTIEPNGLIKGIVIYEIPKDDSEVKEVYLKYSSNEIYPYIIPKSRLETTTNHAPIARITAEDQGFIDTEIEFDATGSSDSDTDSLTYSWDFGDPKVTYDTSTDPKDTYKYSIPGTYMVKLKVKDVGGLENEMIFKIEISHYFSLNALNHGIEIDPTTYHEGDYFVDVRLINNADETKSVYSTDFDIKTSDGASYRWGGDDGDDPSSLGPGASASWRIYFDIPQGKTPIQVIFDDTVICDL